jgi:Repeat of Unknown Function (DUF347)
VNDEIHIAMAKVPDVTIGFWIIKILATTLGETGGDAVSMSMDLGYLVATTIFVLGRYYRLDHGRHDARGFRDAFAGNRLLGRNRDSYNATHWLSLRMAPHLRFGRRRYGEFAAS